MTRYWRRCGWSAVFLACAGSSCCWRARRCRVRETRAASAALHPAYSIKRRTSGQRTHASAEPRHPEQPLALDPLENNIDVKRTLRTAAVGPLKRIGFYAIVVISLGLPSLPPESP